MRTPEQNKELAREFGERVFNQHDIGFANQTLWPLLHDLVHQPVIDRSWWDAYRRANELFADAFREGTCRLPKLFTRME